MKARLIMFYLLIFFVQYSNFKAQSIDSDISNVLKQTKNISHIRWGSKNTPLDGLTITWRSSGTGDKIQWGYTASFEQGEFIPTTYPGYLENFNDYTFPAVTPNSTILYQIYDASVGSYGATQTFDTAPAATGEPYTIIAMGDSRSNVVDWQSIANAANVYDVAAVLFVGDIINDGSVNADWDGWFDYGVDIIKDKLFYHTLGNHETYNGGTTKYLNNFVMPDADTGTELYYSFEYGNAIFINLNSQAAWDGTQLAWLQNTLINNQDKTWKIVWFHRPFYTTGSHAGEMDAYFTTWWQTFDDYGVDLVFNGHDHMYERTKPINRNISTTIPVAEYGSDPGQGRCQIVTGGAGAPLSPVGTAWWLELGASSLHYCKLDIDGIDISITVFDETQTVIDHFTLSKPLAEPINIIISEATGKIILKWDSVVGASSYRVYSFAEPYGTFQIDDSGIFNGEEWITTITEEKKFYYVTASNGKGKIPENIIIEK